MLGAGAATRSGKRAEAKKFPVDKRYERSPLLDLMSCMVCHQTMKLEMIDPEDDGNDLHHPISLCTVRSHITSSALSLQSELVGLALSTVFPNKNTLRVGTRGGNEGGGIEKPLFQGRKPSIYIFASLILREPVSLLQPTF